jgi:hypothetical protein
VKIKETTKTNLIGVAAFSCVLLPLTAIFIGAYYSAKDKAAARAEIEAEFAAAAEYCYCHCSNPTDNDSTDTDTNTDPTDTYVERNL